MYSIAYNPYYELQAFLESKGYKNVYASHAPPEGPFIAITGYEHGAPFGARGINIGVECFKGRVTVRAETDSAAWDLINEIRALLDAGPNERWLELSRPTLCRPGSIYKVDWADGDGVSYRFNMTLQANGLINEQE